MKKTGLLLIAALVFVQANAQKLPQVQQVSLRAPANARADGKPTGEFVLNRGYAEHVRGKRVLVVDDILTTGGSVEAVVRAVLEAGGIVVGVAVLVNRGGVTAETIGVAQLYALANVSLESWLEEDCHYAKKAVPSIQLSARAGSSWSARRSLPNV